MHGELCLTSPAQALRHGAAAALWQRALDGIAPPSPPSVSGEAARDRLAYAVATALGDLFVFRGDDDVAAATLLVALDPRTAAGSGATVHASRPLRVAAIGFYLLWRVAQCARSCLGVRVAVALRGVLLAAQRGGFSLSSPMHRRIDGTIAVRYARPPRAWARFACRDAGAGGSKRRGAMPPRRRTAQPPHGSHCVLSARSRKHARGYDS
jgi:hypothetical protein